ncbi:MAG: hypothetical protein IPP46_10275 [Bacteroidetes bacterium]|nr:hypothetical protein [Bacteroidota bacterium]
MLKSLASGVLILILLMESGSKSILFLNFEIHKEYIAQQLCEKKDVPENRCQGNCQLSKEIKEQDARENKQMPVMTVKSEVSVFELPSFKVLFFNHCLVLIQNEEVLFTRVGYPRDVLRPPSV